MCHNEMYIIFRITRQLLCRSASECMVLGLSPQATRYHETYITINPYANNLLLTLVRDLHRFALCADRCIRCRLLGRNSKLLILKFGESNGPDGHQTDFLEAFEALEDGCEVVLVHVVGDVLQEEHLVRSYVFVWDGGGTCLSCARLLGGDGVGLGLCVLFCALEVC